MRKVLIVGRDHMVERMFLMWGWKLAGPLETDVDLVQFTGGEDISPALYGEEKHPSTYINARRDIEELQVYANFKGKVPFAGICRGGQLLNVLSGGKMWQHVNNHNRQHPAFDVLSETEVMVSSVHHQMMRPSKDGEVLLFANLATTKQTADTQLIGLREPDVEAVFYKETKALCFQPHPEYHDINHECQQLYFKYLNQLFDL